MDVTFECPYCTKPIQADTTQADGRTECPSCHEVVLVPAAGIRVGMMLGDFRIEKCLGVGGMGEVFLATQVAMDRPVALKVLPPAVTSNKALVDRFLNEVRMAGKLEHPNVVTAFYAGEDSGYHYLAMSYVDGEDLEHRIDRQGRIDEREALQICRKLGLALANAWEKHRLLHRDIKPANIMIDKAGEVKLMDMGIAKALTEDSNLTMAGVMVGTPFYMSPEQAKNEPTLDCRTDIYALGGTLFHMVTGSRPYEGPTAISVVAKHLNDPVPSAETQCPAVSIPTTRLISKMMAKKAADRPTDWRELITVIDEILAGQNPRTLELKTEELTRAGLLDIDDDEPRSLSAPSPNATIGVKPTLTRPGTGPAPTQMMPPAAPTQAGAPSPAVTMGDYVQSLPPNPTLPKSLKTALVVIALLIIALIGVLVAREALRLSNSQKNAQLERELKEKGQQIEQKEVVGDVEAQLAAAQTRAELTTEEKLKQQRIADMIEVAKAYEREHPENPPRALEKYQNIREQARGTKYELIVDDEIDRMQRVVRSVRETKARLVGRWVSARFYGENHQSRPGERMELGLNGDGTFDLTRSGSKATGTWLLSHDTLYFYQNEKQMAQIPFQLSTAALTLTWKAGDFIELKRL